MVNSDKNEMSTIDSYGYGGPRKKNIDYQTLGCTATLPRNLERNTTRNSIPHQVLLPQRHLHLHKLSLKIDNSKQPLISTSGAVD